MPAQQGCTPEAVQIDFEQIYDSEAYHTTTLQVLQTALNITGRGKVKIIKAWGANIQHYIRLTIDGNIIINDRGLFQNASIGNHIGDYDFNYSVLVEHRNNNNVTEVRLVIPYIVN